MCIVGTYTHFILAQMIFFIVCASETQVFCSRHSCIHARHFDAVCICWTTNILSVCFFVCCCCVLLAPVHLFPYTKSVCIFLFFFFLREAQVLTNTDLCDSLGQYKRRSERRKKKKRNKKKNNVAADFAQIFSMDHRFHCWFVIRWPFRTLKLILKCCQMLFVLT